MSLTTKSTKVTKKTLTVTFNIENTQDEKLAKAIAIYFGGYNPHRNEMTDEKACLSKIEAIKEFAPIEDILSNITKYLK